MDKSMIIICENDTTVGTTESHASGDRVSPALAGSGQGRRNPPAFRQW
ncbi:MAG: hypothetical protein HWN65_03110 [Candidatus Helarchaeota archaeon]|nr:hypothetical protein [Candidatus Helarchaeota archaeon]